jgi:hypothetical protein
MKYSAQPRREGPPSEGKKIQRRRPNVISANDSEIFANDFNKENKGLINYDPILGWVLANPLGAEAVGQDIKHSKNYLRRADGLPGSRP